jgi:hypothetical protein
MNHPFINTNNKKKTRNIVESGVKHHKPKPDDGQSTFYLKFTQLT